MPQARFLRPAGIGPGAFKVGDTRAHQRTCIRQRIRAFPVTPAGGWASIERVHGSQVFPDSSALGAGDDPQWLYTVVFDGRELWGADADPTLKVSIDAFEPYLEAA